MDRARSAMRDPHHEPELSLCATYFAAVAKAKPSSLEREVADINPSTISSCNCAAKRDTMRVLTPSGRRCSKELAPYKPPPGSP